MSVGTGQQLEALAGLLNAQGASGGGPQEGTARDRGMRRIEGRLKAWSAERVAEDAVSALQRAGVPSAVVQSVEDLAVDPQFAARGFWKTAPHPIRGEVKADRFPAQLGAGEDAGWTPAPQLGEHNRYVFRELFGLSEREYAEACARGIIE